MFFWKHFPKRKSYSGIEIFYDKSHYAIVIGIIKDAQSVCNKQHCFLVFLEDKDLKIEVSPDKATAPLRCNMWFFDDVQFSTVG